MGMRNALAGLAATAALVGCGSTSLSGDARACELFYELADDFKAGDVTFAGMLDRVDAVADEAERNSDVAMTSAVLVNATRRGDEPDAAAAIIRLGEICGNL